MGSDGSVTNQSITLTDNNITINNHMEATIEVLDSAGYQSILGDGRVLAQRFATQFGPRLAERADNDLFALHADSTLTQVGSTSSPGEFSSAMLRLAQQRLDEQRVLKSNRSAVLAPQAFWELFSEDKMALAYATGLKMGVTVSGPDSVPTIFGLKYFQSPEIASTGSPAVHKNLVLHKEGLALVMQRNIQIVPLAKTALTTRITGHVLYDVASIRDDHFVVINSADT